jgi:hypothetical protein
MKPVMQTEFGQGRGNCLSACLASIMEIPVDVVPNFCYDGADDEPFGLLPPGSTWLERLAHWLSNHGWGMMTVDWNEPPTGWILANTYVIASGPNPDGIFHALVGHVDGGRLDHEKKQWHWDVKILHDPNPSQRGITEIRDLIVVFPWHIDEWPRRRFDLIRGYKIDHLVTGVC